MGKVVEKGGEWMRSRCICPQDKVSLFFFFLFDYAIWALLFSVFINGVLSQIPLFHSKNLFASVQTSQEDNKATILYFLRQLHEEPPFIQTPDICTHNYSENTSWILCCHVGPWVQVPFVWQAKVFIPLKAQTMVLAQVCVWRKGKKSSHMQLLYFFLTYPQHSPYSRFESCSFLSPSPWHNRERG